MKRERMPSGGTIIFGECPEGARIIADMIVDKTAQKMVSSWSVETCPPQYRFNKESVNDGNAAHPEGR